MARSTRRSGRAAHHPVKPGEMVPVADRIRWMLGCRLLLTVAIMVVWWLQDMSHGTTTTWWACASIWPAVTALTLFAARGSRGVARVCLTLSLLGDGVLLGLAGWALGRLFGAVGFVIILHAVAVTLLASFRTGVRIAVWHCLTATLLLDAVSLGLLDDTGLQSLGTAWPYFVGLWVAVFGIAGLAAMNERELRRRRHDSEQLRQLGLAVSAAPSAPGIAGMLAEFAQHELQARKVAVLTCPAEPDTDDSWHGIGATADDDGTKLFAHLDKEAEPGSHSVVRMSLTTGALLMRGLDARADGWLRTQLQDATRLIVMPFTVNHIVGALVAEPSARRVERRAVETTEQAVQHAAIALDRTILTERIRTVSETDGLTRVANRRRFDEILREELRNAAASGTPLALALIDIDHFKRLNDTYGHLIGDDVLRHVAATVRESIGDPYVVARYGGEEFALIMPGADAAAAVATADRIRLNIAAMSTVTEVTASLGVALHGPHTSDAQTLIAAADSALYQSKRGGRNQVTLAENDEHIASAPEAA